MYVFPTDIPEPIIPAASNSGSTYTEVLTDSTITSTTDANYKITRPRTTRVIGSWTYTWLGLSDENYEKLKAFWKKVRTSEEFEFKNYTDGKTYRCRFVDKLSFRLDYPIGWYGSLQFEEV